MEAKAIARHVRMSPRKVRRVVDMVRGKSVDEALTILKYVPQIAAEPVSKVIASAAANAENNLDLTRDDLYIAQAFVDAGPTLKRVLPRMRGMADRVLKRTSHITVVVREREG
ncbi:MAG: 50S ribosomal protein L22 [Bacillota bacterium]